MDFIVQLIGAIAGGLIAAVLVLWWLHRSLTRRDDP